MSEESNPSENHGAAKQPSSTRPGSGTLLVSGDLAKQLAWFVLRLLVSYTVVAIAVESLSPLLEVLIARAARNLLAFVSSPYYLKTIGSVDEAYAVTSWIGPLQDGFKLPSLSFVFAFSIGYVLALPGILRGDYWLRAVAVVFLSFFVCAISVAIVADARLTTAFEKLEIVVQPAWRAGLANFLQYYLWMLTVRLYPLVMVIVLTWESGAFRKVSGPDHSVRSMRIAGAAGLALLLAIAIGFDSAAERRIVDVAAESMSKRTESLSEMNPDLGMGLVNLATHMLRQRNQRGALQMYRQALDHLEGPERRKVLADYNRIHADFKERMLEDAKARRAQRGPAGRAGNAGGAATE
ncbi:MAG: hypothetical protein QF570_21580 [Myxococcota bacterium]|jgi:hypothetical protein|nr:hypothetical protein [Myxococcota bacterium]